MFTLDNTHAQHHLPFNFTSNSNSANSHVLVIKNRRHGIRSDGSGERIRAAAAAEGQSGAGGGGGRRGVGLAAHLRRRDGGPHLDGPAGGPLPDAAGGALRRPARRRHRPRLLPGGDVPDLRVYLPTARNTPSEDCPRGGLPVLLHLQGGGFCISHPSWLMYHQFYARLARSVPAAVVSLALPLAPERRLPAALDAAAAALRHLPLLPPSVAARLDLSRVFPIGDSSGGNLVHLLAAAADGGRYGPVGLAGGILLHPGFVRSTRSRSELEQRADSVFFTLDMLDKFLALALPPGATKDHPYTCPMGPAAPPLESLPLPPFLVGVAEHDLIVDTNMEYCDAMKRAGKDVEVLLSRGVSHSFYLNKFAVDTDPLTADRTHELILAIANFIRRH
uniref:Alpha/beta hydrolase fold-3 domain-containing protein n=1 Tax=Ananas comosus var. bracteatus TaxID=296719 RepID=A0A6V7PF46_ANACO|nr:unnamed protein product [Ananas comosus var. bracteatus]